MTNSRDLAGRGITCHVAQVPNAPLPIEFDTRKTHCRRGFQAHRAVGMRHVMRTARGLVIATLCLGGLMASPVGATTTTSDGTFARRADAACAAAGAKITKSPKVTSKNVVQAVKTQTAIASKLVSDLKKISAPKAKATRFRSFITATQSQIADLRKAITAAKANHRNEANSLLAKVAASGKRSDKIAAGLGLPACAKDYEARG